MCQTKKRLNHSQSNSERLIQGVQTPVQKFALHFQFNSNHTHNSYQAPEIVMRLKI